MSLYLQSVSSEGSLGQLEENVQGSLGQLEENVQLGPRALVSQCAFRKLLKISVPRKGGDLPYPHVRSFGELSDLENLTIGDGDDTESAEEDEIVPHEILIQDQDKSMIEMAMLGLWEMCQEKGLFRYDITTCTTKTLPGRFGFVSQLNEGRAQKKRPTEFRVDKVVQAFDETKFNFTKAYMQEVLFQFDTKASDGTEIVENATTGRSPDLVMINVCPIEYGHVLLVPRVLDRLTQIVDPSTMSLALQFASAICNPYFRLGYNSLGAFATINHLHFQGYYLMAPYPVERAPTVPIKDTAFDPEYVKVSELVGYPVKGWVFEMSAGFDHSLEPVASAVGHVCMKLQEMNVPHNMLICDCGARVFLWPQCYAEKQAKGLVPDKLLELNVNPAAFEIAGHMILKTHRDFEEMNQMQIWKFLSEVSLCSDSFLELTEACLKPDTGCRPTKFVC